MNQATVVPLSQLLCGRHAPLQSKPSQADAQSVTEQRASRARNTSQADLFHAELLGQFLTKTIQSCDFPQTITAGRYLDLASDAPFLLQQALAITACHISSFRPSQTAYYKERAVALREAAISTYTSTIRGVDDTNCVALLLFSGFLGIQRLFEAATTCNKDPDVFLDTILLFIDVQRGARLIAHQSWLFLCRSELASFLQTAAQASPKVSKDEPRECDLLWCLMEKAQMGDVSLKACQEAITSLQRCFDVAHTSERKDGDINNAFAWPATVSAEFVSLLASRTPVALIILAFYGRLLHRHRNVWFVSNTGQRLIESITLLVGPSWTPWLAWSNQFLMPESML
jgi:hypothetical protein